MITPDTEIDLSYNNIKKIIAKFGLQFSEENLKSIKLRKIDRVWIYLCCNLNILEKIKENKVYKITAEQIKIVNEPRLSVKFDHINNLPIIFKNNNLSILPDSRGTYSISNYKVYKKFNLETKYINLKPEIFEIPEYLSNLDYNNITSEAIALNTAYATGIIADFIEDEKVFPTLSGRMSSNTFNFNIETYDSKVLPFSVDKSQIEIDAAYEGIKYLSIFEAKLGLSNDFMIRQLYYPYRTLSQKVKKQIKPIFLTYSNNLFTLYEYTFLDLHSYNSLVLAKYKQYRLIPQKISLTSLFKLIEQVEIQKEPFNIPFIQANDFNRVINLCELLKINIALSREKIASIYDFNERQSDYYCNADLYLRLIKKNKKIYTLSPLGEKIFSLNHNEKQIELIKLLLEHEPIKIVLKQQLNSGKKLSGKEAYSFIKNCNFNKTYGETTLIRRSGSVSSWVNYIVKLISD